MQPQFIVNEKGERVSVILSIEDYNELLEEMEDLTTIASRAGEPTTPHEQVIAELKADGLL
ncbi:MAG: hypothetical protein HQL49_09865 [Gammaproteobacteria bacterium]|nr:hypothetical protein [Gammaproteobacteria bacterium]